MNTGDLPAYWPASAQAAAYLERVQKLLEARGLTGTERRLMPLMRKVTEAFRAQDLAGVTAACDALVDAVAGGSPATQ